MWGTNSQRFQSNNKQTYELGKNTINFYPNVVGNTTNNNEINLLFQTPSKQIENLQNNTNSNPFHFDFNIYFGNLWSSGHLPNNPILDQPLNISPSQINKDNFSFCKKYMEKSSYKLTPISQIKDSNSFKNILNNSNIDVNNNNDLTKKNLSDLFNDAKNESFLCSSKIQNNTKNINNNINNANNNCKKIYINQNIPKIKRRYSKLQISHQFIFSSPNNLKKPKKIFECSGSTACNSNIKMINKKRRFRKNNDQLELLKKFYLEHKYWSKSQIKEISAKIGLKENKVYKWLWDQRNKEFKSTKFVINKSENENENEK